MELVKRLVVNSLLSWLVDWLVSWSECESVCQPTSQRVGESVRDTVTVSFRRAITNLFLFMSNYSNISKNSFYLRLCCRQFCFWVTPTLTYWKKVTPTIIYRWRTLTAPEREREREREYSILQGLWFSRSASQIREPHTINRRSYHKTTYFPIPTIYRSISAFIHTAFEVSVTHSKNKQDAVHGQTVFCSAQHCLTLL